MNSRSSLDGGRLRLDDEGGDDTQDEFTFIGTRVADHDEAATGFYATLDVEGTAHLPTLLADNLQHRGDRDTRHDVFANYGTALAAASRAMGPNHRRLDGRWLDDPALRGSHH